ncbi:MAG: sigma-54 interaction domain-containing protein [Candidatus Scalindua sp.]
MLKDTNILLLDTYPSSNLGSTLKGILESSTDLSFQFQEEKVEIFSTTLFLKKFSSSILHFNPDLITIILSPAYQEHIEALFRSLNGETSGLPVIVVMEGCKSDDTISLLKLGIDDFITPPLKAFDVLPRVWRLIQQAHKRRSLTHTLKEKFGLKQLVGENLIFIKEIKKIPIVAECDSTVLVSGETGTGKELFARAIHYLSPRASKPFVPVNCGAIPADLMENELFGHVRGAFTGASGTQQGLIREADEGTLFLDEIDCLTLPGQIKLLRFLQDKEFRQIGSSKLQQADVRVIAATNIDLEEAVREGKFRRDLFYRLNIIPIMLPPLRERKEDIPILSRHFLDRYSSEFNKQVSRFTPEVLRKLLVYEWPGNVRELENVIERAVLFSGQADITDVDIVFPHLKVTSCQESFKEAKAKIIAQFERTYIEGLLLAHQGNITKAARMAKKNRRSFWQLINKHHIDVHSFKSSHL